MSEHQHGYIHRKDDYLKRLRRIEGQARGLQRMVEDEKYCIDILTQVAAMTKALQAISLGLLAEHMNHCVLDAARSEHEGAAQEKMLADAFGGDLTEEKRKQMQAAMATSNAVIQKHLSWDALEPIVRKVYTQVFSAREVQAMTAFYASPEGASILKKSPQAMALTMQEIQPVMLAAMQEVKAAIEQQAAAAQ